MGTPSPEPAAGGGPFLISPATYKKIVALLDAGDVVPDPSQFETITKNGVKYFRLRDLPSGGEGGGGGGRQCNFATIYTDNGNLMIRGGVVSGGTGVIEVDDENIGSASSPPDEKQVWLEVEFDATVEDGVLLPGGNVTGATINSGASLPDNTMPTATSASGTLVIQLGEFMDGTFLPSGGCGNFQIFHCPGSLSYTRG